ncbi:putative phosphatase [Clostridia bacterium]|nr:putative phosphatase [Clostridia bacterium]
MTIIWDWNGTLLDDVDACVDAENSLLADRHMPPIDLVKYHEMFSFPVIDYYRRVGFTFENETFAAVSDQYNERYLELSRTCKLFDDAVSALELLRSTGFSQILVTAASEDLLRAQLTPFDIANYFEAMIAQKDGFGHGKTESARLYLVEHNIDPSEIVMIGDTEHDREVADSLGAACVLVPRGHHSRERLLNHNGKNGIVKANLIDAARWIIDNSTSGSFR